MPRLFYRRSGKPFLITVEKKSDPLSLLEVAVVFLVLFALGLYVLAGGR